MCKNEVALLWLLRGIEDFFMGFQIDNPFSRYRPFFYSMGVEMVGKSYLLAKRASAYETLDDKQARTAANKIAKEAGHSLKRLVDELKGSTRRRELDAVLGATFDGFSGVRLLDALGAAYMEARYPIPNPIEEKFPVEGVPGAHWKPLCGSGLGKFCLAFTREIVYALKMDFGIVLPRSSLDYYLSGTAGPRFLNALFESRADAFLA